MKIFDGRKPNFLIMEVNKVRGMIRITKMLLVAGIAAILFILVLLMARGVLADTNVGIDVWSNESVNIYGNIFTNGSVDVTIDGMNMNQELSQLRGGKIEWSDLKYLFEYMAVWFNEGRGIVDQRVIDIFSSLNRVFVNRIDGALMNTKLNDLNYRTTALEKTIEEMNSEAYCQGKIDTMTQFKLNSVKCGNTTYYNTDGQIIGIEVSQ